MEYIRNHTEYILVYNDEKYGNPNIPDSGKMEVFAGIFGKQANKQIKKFGMNVFAEKRIFRKVETYTVDQFCRVFNIGGKHAVPERLEISVYFYGADDQKTQP